MPESIKLEVQNMEFTQIAKHPNKMLWKGILTRVGSASDSPPCGSGGMRLIITQEAAQKALPTLENMPLNCVYDDGLFADPALAMTGHDTRFIIGSISSGEVVGDALVAQGIIWKDNFPDIAFLINNAVEALGFSIELYPNEYKEDENENLIVSDCVFTGAAVLWKKCAAFESTEFQQLVASKFKTTKEVDNDMNDEQLKAILGEFMTSIKAEIGKVNDGVVALSTEVENMKAQAEEKAKKDEEAKLAAEKAKAEEEAKVQAEKEKLAKEAEEKAKLEAAKIPPAPTVLTPGQKVESNGDFKDDKVDAEKKIAEINASKSMSPFEKVKAISALRYATTK